VGLRALSSEVGNAALKQTALSFFAKCNRGATATEKKNSEFCCLFSYHIKHYCESQSCVFATNSTSFSGTCSSKVLWGFFNAESSPEDIKYGRFPLVQGGLTF